MDVITFRNLITLVVSGKLSMQLMDVVTAYLYRDLDIEIYMKVPYIDWFKYFQTLEHVLNSAEVFTLWFETIRKNVV